MLVTSVLRALPVALLFVVAQGSPVAQDDGARRQASVDQFIKTQADVSIKGVLANIGTDGSKAKGAAAGVVVASPSKSDPDCEYIPDKLLTVSPG
jgi:glucoamylase